VINLANGERMETYAIRGEPGSGECVLNGGMAHKGKLLERPTDISPPPPASHRDQEAGTEVA